MKADNVSVPCWGCKLCSKSWHRMY
jgi:hypothetical protein